MADDGDRLLRAMFGKPVRPTITISRQEIALEARKLAGKLSISGVQPKLSMRLEGDLLVPVASEGQFILKPQTQEFEELPQNEAVCMAMGSRFGLATAVCMLMPLADGSPALLVKRFDRFRKGRRMEKLACEDMHQILGGADKYAGSHEAIADAIREHCTFAPLELQRFFELTIFNFAIGNSDAHRKNFSLLQDERRTIALSPAYDLVSSRLVLEDETEELALSLNGRKEGLGRADFVAFAAGLGIDGGYAARRMGELAGMGGVLGRMIAESALSERLRTRLRAIVAERLGRLGAGPA